MSVEDLIRDFQQHQYAALELPGLSGGDVARLLGEQIRPKSEDVVEVGMAFFYRDPRDLARRFGAWLARQDYRLVPADPEVVLQAHEQPGSGLAVAYYRIVEAE